MAYHHVDVLSAVAYAGNSVIVNPSPLTTTQMALVTREDVATGSAAGCVAPLLLRHGRAGDGEERFLSQGRFTGRPSRLAIIAYGSPDAVERVTAGGDVATVATGFLRHLPEAR